MDKKVRSYKDAGVDIEAGYEAVNLMKDHVKSTFNENVIKDIGSFGALFNLDTKKFFDPVLVSGTDGVGTKLKIAFILDKHDTVGIDCVAMCVNDIICQGATPLFFLDYIATGKLSPQKVSFIVKGISEGCKEASCALIGGETAEMPDFYKEGEYDIAGFVVGAVNKNEIIDGSTIDEGDIIIGLESSGLHSNGFSLVRKILFNDNSFSKDQYIKELNSTIGEALLTPTKIYVKTILDLKNKINIKGLAHITGGGFYENIPRILPENKQAVIEKGSWKVQPIFNLIQEKGNIEEEEMFKTFNMGIGMIIIVSSEDEEKALSYLNKSKIEKAYKIGEIKRGNNGVKLLFKEDHNG